MVYLKLTMNIEVTRRTFWLLFNSKNFVQTERLELAKKHHYYNDELEQKGVQVYNFVSRVNQYYLTDINA